MNQKEYIQQVARQWQTGDDSRELDNKIVIYQTADGKTQLDVKLENETVWLTQAQMAELFNSSKANVSEHIKHIYQDGELDENSTVRKFRTVRLEGSRQVARNVTYYNLDLIISLGYRVNTKRGIQFRQWATNVLKNYLIKGYAINQRIREMWFMERERHSLRRHAQQAHRRCNACGLDAAHS